MPALPGPGPTATDRAPGPGGARSFLQSIGAGRAGRGAIFGFTPAPDLVMHATRVFPPWGQPMAGALFVLATAYRIVYGVLGCYIAARLAPARPMQHALVLGAVGVVLSIAGAVALRGSPGPAWYPIALILISVPCAWAGGKLRVRQLTGRS